MSLLSSLRHTVVLSAIFLGLGGMQQARAATFIVTSTADIDGSTCGTDCTLRQAINAVNKDVDDSDVIVFDETVFASKQTIQLTGPTYPKGTYVGLPAIWGNVSIIGPTASGSGLTISGDKGPYSYGMEISSPLNHTSKVTLANLHITDANKGINNQGGDLTVTNCTFSNNIVGIMTLNMDWFSTASITKPYQRISPILTVNNCTFAGNSMFGIEHYDGTTRVDSCTITGSDIGVSCGDGAVTVFNSLMVGNKTFNLCSYEDPKCSVTKVGQNITLGTPEAAGLDPRGLRDNGGPTPTIALIKGSAAIDAGAADLLTDQRGKPRSQGERIDIGAFEYDDDIPPVPLSR